MHIAIMQPYFLPYLGYFQLMAAADRFVIYDTVEYTKKGWVNRNRLLRDGEPVTFSLPLKKDSDFLDIRERRIAPDFNAKKLIAQFEGAYQKAPEFRRTMPLLNNILGCQETNLFSFIQYSLECCRDHLGIKTPIVVSSQIEGDVHGKGTDRVLDLCAKLGADRYTNPIGGLDLYRPSVFRNRGITLRFLKSRAQPYAQFGAPFQPYLSIIDVLMFNSAERITEMVSGDYDILEGREETDVSLA